METNDPKTEFVRPHFRAYDAYYHANAKGTGCACKISLHPAHDDTAGSIFVSLAPQRNVGGITTFPIFDWANAITAKLDRNDLALVIEVLRGIKDTINDDKGIFHRNPKGNLVIKFTHQIDPQPSYGLTLWLSPSDGGDARVVSYVFNLHEAFALMLSLEQAMVYVAFGVPEVFATDKGQTPNNL